MKTPRRAASGPAATTADRDGLAEIREAHTMPAAGDSRSTDRSLAAVERIIRRGLGTRAEAAWLARWMLLFPLKPPVIVKSRRRRDRKGSA